MTRAELAAQRVKRLTEALAAARQDRNQREAQQQAKERLQNRQALNKRRFHVGALADEAGLFQWEDETLRALFAVLARLEDAPDPVKVLDSLLAQGR